MTGQTSERIGARTTLQKLLSRFHFGITLFAVALSGLTILLAGTPFVVWDLYATHAGHWWFDAGQTLPPRIAGLPLEEIAFFVVIPLVSVLTFEAVRAVGRRGGVRAAAARSDERRVS